MIQDQQNRNWACLPKETREIPEDFYKNNILSPSEPPELLHVERSKVIELCLQTEKNYTFTESIHFRWLRDALVALFGNKCLPDPSEPEPEQTLKPTVQAEPETKPTLRFKEGDKVRIINVANPMMRDEIGIIATEPRGGDPRYKVQFEEDHYTLLEECYLAPYTETKDCYEQYCDSKAAETQQTNDNMEEKELNLCELLSKGNLLEEEFYSPAFGKVTLEDVIPSEREVVIMDVAQGVSYSLNPYGCLFSTPDGQCVLFPSRDLYLKYPLEAAKAWQIWAEERKPKIWRAEEKEEYWLINTDGVVTNSIDYMIAVDDRSYTFGNYFKTKALAKEAAGQIRELLKTFHEQHPQV